MITRERLVEYLEQEWDALAFAAMVAPKVAGQDWDAAFSVPDEYVQECIAENSGEDAEEGDSEEG